MRPSDDRAAAFTAFLLALALAAGTTAALIAPRPAHCRPPAALAERPGLLRPAPLVSLGCPVAASARGAGVLVDGTYRTTAWAGGRPTPQRPAWVAIQLPPGLTRVLVSWTSSHNHDLFEQFYGAPVDYRLETSADSRDGADGTWRTVLEVRDNPARTRAHALPFQGQRWVRLSMTRLPDRVNEWGLFLDEIDVHDLSGGGDDVWLFLGDSIDAGVFDRSPAHQPSFSRWVARAHPGYWPVMVNAGLPRLRSYEAAERVDEVLALFPDAKVVAVTLGSNDGDLPRLEAALHAVVDKVQRAGRIPLLSRIPFQTKYGEDYVAVKNQVVDQVASAARLWPGPDLYAWFKAHPERLHDGLHPDGQGSVDMQRLWAEAGERLYAPIERTPGSDLGPRPPTP
jgi:lysophospholipase L1-like esterase